MKKIIIGLISVICTISMVSCGNSQNDDYFDNRKTTQKETATETAETSSDEDVAFYDDSDYKKGLEYFNDEKYTKALKSFMKVSNNNINYSMAQSKMKETYIILTEKKIEDKDYDDAYSWIKDAKECFPDDEKINNLYDEVKEKYDDLNSKPAVKLTPEQQQYNDDIIEARAEEAEKLKDPSYALKRGNEYAEETYNSLNDLLAELLEEDKTVENFSGMISTKDEYETVNSVNIDNLMLDILNQNVVKIDDNVMFGQIYYEIKDGQCVFVQYRAFDDESLKIVGTEKQYDKCIGQYPDPATGIGTITWGIKS